MYSLELNPAWTWLLDTAPKEKESCFIHSLIFSTRHNFEKIWKYTHHTFILLIPSLNLTDYYRPYFHSRIAYKKKYIPEEFFWDIIWGYTKHILYKKDYKDYTPQNPCTNSTAARHYISSEYTPHQYIETPTY